MKNVVSQILKQHFEKKKKDFPGLSTRWLGQKLSVSQVYVSQILSGKRPLPGALLDRFCELLDIDAEKKEILSNEILKAQGWAKAPSRKIREVALDNKSHALDWDNAPARDLPLLTEHRYLLVLESTQLVDFDGTAAFIAERTGLSVADVEEALERLQEAGYLVLNGGKPRKAKSLMELQSRVRKRDVVRFHQSAMEIAIRTMHEKTEAADLEARLITTSIFTCSREHVPLLRAKLAEFMKELTSEAAEQEADEVYQLGLAFVPLAPRGRGSR